MTIEPPPGLDADDLEELCNDHLSDEDESSGGRYPGTPPPAHLRGRPATWSWRSGWRATDAPEWTAAVDEVTELLRRWDLGAAHRVRAAADRAVLSVPEFLALSEIAARPVALTGATVADIVGVGSGGISQILTRLEEQELIERERDPDDARSVVSFPTDAGRALLHDETDDLPGHTLTDLMRGLSLEQVRIIACFVEVVIDRAYRQVRHLRRLDRKR